MENKKILLVEDDLYIREIYSYTLGNAGYIIEVAEDGEIGLEKIRNNDYDLIILDIMLPKKSGVDVVNTIFSPDYPKKNLNVYLLSNLAQESIINDALQKGVQGFILKNKILPQDLLTEVNNILNIKTE